MKKFSIFSFLKFYFFLSIVFCVSVNAQVTKATYKKAEYFLTNSIQKEIYNLEVIPNWIKDNNAFWHVTYTKEGKRFLLTDTAKKETKNAFDHELLAKLLNEATGDSLKSTDLPFDRIKFKSDDKLEFEWKNKNWEFDNQKLLCL